MNQLNPTFGRPGEAFTGVLDKPVSVDGRVAIAIAKGEIASIPREGMLHHSSKLLLALTGLIIEGEAYPIQTPDAEFPSSEARPAKLFGKIGSVVTGLGRDIQQKMDDKNAVAPPGSATAPGERLAFQLAQPLSIQLQPDSRAAAN